MMRKGYVYVVLFSLFLGIAGPIQYRLYVKRDFNEMSAEHLLLRITIAFLMYVIPGLLLVRWYYKMKDK